MKKIHFFWGTWILLIAVITCVHAHGQKKPGKGKKEAKGSLLPAAGYEAHADPQQVKLGKPGSEAPVTKSVTVAPGYCYRVFLVSKSKSMKVRIELLEGSRVVAESLPGSLAFADYCHTGEKKKMLTVRLTSAGKAGAAAFSMHRKKMKGEPSDDDVAWKLAGLGKGDQAGAVVTGYLKAKGKAAVTLHALEEQCQWLTMAQGKGLKNVSLQAADAKGAKVESSTTEGKVVVKWCPDAGASKELTVEIKAVSGSGMFAFGRFLKAGPVGVIDVDGKSSKQLMIERVHHFLSRLSPGMAAVPGDKVYTIDGETSELVKVKVKAGVCYRMAATADHTVKNLTLEVVQSKNKNIKGSTFEDFVMAELCPKSGGSVTVKLTASGIGGAALSIFAGSRDAVIFAAGGGSYDLDNLLSKLYAARDKYGAKMAPADTPVTGMLGLGKTKSHGLQIDKDFCYRIIAVSTCEKACGLELSALKGDKVLVSDASKTGEAMVEFCPDGNFKTDLALKLTSTDRGKEGYALMALRKKAKSKLKVYAAGDMKKDYVAKKIIEKSKTACKGKSAVSPVLRGKLMTNEVKTFDVELTGEICYTIVAAGAPSVKDLKVIFISPIGQEIASENKAGPIAVVSPSTCPQWDGTYKIKVKMFNGYGGFGLQVFGDVNE